MVVGVVAADINAMLRLDAREMLASDTSIGARNVARDISPEVLHRRTEVKETADILRTSK
jgi:hypothetical protein